jgi:hypothetical protein
MCISHYLLRKRDIHETERILAAAFTRTLKQYHRIQVQINITGEYQVDIQGQPPQQ